MTHTGTCTDCWARQNACSSDALGVSRGRRSMLFNEEVREGFLEEVAFE